MGSNGRTVWGVVAGVVAALGMTLGGCGGTPKVKPLTLQIVPDASLRDPGTNTMGSVDVDLVAVTESDKARWMAKNPSEYFTGGDPDRAEAAAYSKRYSFSDADVAAKTLSAGDAIWKDSWAGKSGQRPYLFVFANSRVLANAPAGGQERRRKGPIPLFDECWKDHKGTTISVKGNGISVSPEWTDLPPK